MTESFEDLISKYDNLDIRQGSLLNAEVMEIGDSYVVVDAGLKSEAHIPVEQFKEADGSLTIKVGEEVEVALEFLENSYGETGLSRERAKRIRVWKELEKAQETNETVTGIITGKVKGGFTVEMGGVKGFLPGSLLDVKPLRDSTELENIELPFKVIKIDAKRNNIVVSRRAVILSENSGEREELMASLAEGKVLKGVVKNITDYGAFVDLGGIDGLLHITDMSWKRIKHPSELIQVGDEIDVKVLKFDADKSRVSLGIKQLGDDPWVGLVSRFPEGKRFSGKVTNVADYGCFVELDQGVEGLVHVSEMDWTNKNITPSKLVQVGQEVEVIVLDVDEERRRISLGIKQCIDNPWNKFSQTYKKGDRVKGTIKSITDFGVFLGLEGNIDGLIHQSDLSWDRPGEEMIRELKKGQEMEVVVLSVDADRERISLGLKQLDSDAFTQFIDATQKGDLVKGTVEEVDAKGVHVALEGDIEGFIRLSELSSERIDDPKKHFKSGDAVEALMMGSDRKNRVINLSIKALESKDEKASADAYKSSSDAQVKTTLGDILKDKLDEK